MMLLPQLRCPVLKLHRLLMMLLRCLWRLALLLWMLKFSCRQQLLHHKPLKVAAAELILAFLIEGFGFLWFGYDLPLPPGLCLASLTSSLGLNDRFCLEYGYNYLELPSNCD